MKTMSRIKMISLILILTCLSLLGWSMRQVLHFSKTVAPLPVKIARPDTASQRIVYDTALVKKFTLVCQAFNVKNGPLTYAGRIDRTDGTDSTQNIRNLNFLCMREGNNCYYRSGRTETINQDGLYLYIEHERRHVMISSQKELTQAMPLAALDNIVNKLQGEHYRMVDTKNGDNETISLLNEHHITCKEYSLTFNTISRKVNRVHIRLSCFEDPLNRKKESVVNMSITRFERSAGLSLYNPGRIVAKAAGGWKLKAPYLNYQLITLP